MRDVDILFGNNAGKIWRALDSNESLTKTQLIKETELDETELLQAIGWLAKENKIKKDGEFYFLDQTNLSDKIENNAVKILKLFENGKINIDKLEYIIKMDEETYNLALGWLARGGKLENDILTDNSESTIEKIEIDNLKNEINSLNNDLESRDLIIKQITDQLTSNQFNLIEDVDKHNKIKIEIDRKNNKLIEQKNELNSKKLEIEGLKSELNNVNSDIETRNIIIKQITDQLSEKQTQFIENSTMIKKLESDLNQNNSLTKMANKKLSDRINNFSSVQEALEKEKINSDISKSTLFSKPDSIFNTKEKVGNTINDTNESQRENLISESEKIDHSTLKNRKNQIGD